MNQNVKIKGKGLLLAVAVTVTLTGCQTQKPEGDGNNGASLAADVLVETVGEDVSQSNQEVQVSEELLDIPDFSGETDFTYVYDTDAQSDLSQYSNVVYTKDGCYDLEWMNAEAFLLYYTDAMSNDTIPVCSRSNCTHSDQSCDAYFSRQEYPMSILEMYQGKLYMINLEGDYLTFCSVSQDGAVREKSCTLMRLNVQESIDENGDVVTNFYYPEIKLHRGYAYFSDYYPGSASCGLYRVKLDSQEEPELLFSISDHFPAIYRLKPYGRYVTFQAENADANNTNFVGGIYAYDIEEGTIWKLCDQVVMSYTIQGDFLYYIDLYDNLYQKNLVTGETVPFGEGEEIAVEDECDTQLFFYEENLVLSFTSESTAFCTQYVLDPDGNIVTVLKGYIYEDDIPAGQSKEEVDTLLHPYTF